MEGFNELHADMIAHAAADNAVVMEVVQALNCMVEKEYDLYQALRLVEPQSASVRRRLELETAVEKAYAVVQLHCECWTSNRQLTMGVLADARQTVARFDHPIYVEDAEAVEALAEMKECVKHFEASLAVIRAAVEGHELAYSLVKALDAKVLSMN